MTRAGPLRKEFVLACDICETELHLLVDVRIYKVQEWEETTECIPETSVGVKISVTYLSVVWAVVHWLSSLVDLVEVAWEECTSVEARVGCTILILRTSAYLDAAE
jgi:hypothetical protein